MDKNQRAQRRIAEVCRKATTPAELFKGIPEALASEVPADRWCGLTLDPATTLPTGGAHEGGPRDMGRLLELEFGGADVNGFGQLARQRSPVGTLARATSGNKQASGRYRDVFVPEGIEDEMRTVFRDASGTWGALILFRDRDVADFSENHMALLASVADDVTRAIRRVLLLSEIKAQAEPEAPALLMLAGNSEYSVRFASASAQRWLVEIEDGSTAGQLPFSLYSLAARARSTGKPALSRIRTRAGRWITAHAECTGGDEREVSLILEASRPHEVAQVMSAAYGLTPRECDVVRLVAAGLANPDIARLLFVSRHTVEDHLKKLYDKLSVNSRSALVSKLYFDQYLPRTEAGAPLGHTGWYLTGPQAPLP